MKTLKRIAGCLLLLCLGMAAGHAQTGKSVYGDQVKADVKMNYVYDFDEALRLAREQNKPVFFNCFVDWAVPCHGMNKYVFSDQAFCDFMNKTFVNLWMDMTTAKGNELALKYRVRTYAHYLVLDADGNVIHRIVGGSKLPDFRNQVEMALSDSTSLSGTARRYAAGDHSRSSLYHYVKALRLADEDSLFTVVGQEYLKLLRPADLAKKDNWMLARLAIPDRNCDNYRYLVAHKQLFADSIGARIIDNFLESLVCREVMQYAMGSVTFDEAGLDSLRRVMDEAQLPDTCVSRTFYDIAKLRVSKDYRGLLNYLQTYGHRLLIYRANLELSLDFSDMNAEDKALLVAYLKEAAVREGNTSAGKRLASFATLLEKGEGIDFDHGPFSEVLARAKREGKLVFMDCFTSWCGPCRMMASVVFPRKDVGDAFNPRFVSFKCDMEKGEGLELAKKYGVKVYPTLLVLDADGNLLHTLTGAHSPQELIRMAEQVTAEK